MAKKVLKTKNLQKKNAAKVCVLDHNQSVSTKEVLVSRDVMEWFFRLIFYPQKKNEKNLREFVLIIPWRDFFLDF